MPTVSVPANPATLDITRDYLPPYYQRLTFTIVPVELMTFTVE